MKKYKSHVMASGTMSNFGCQPKASSMITARGALRFHASAVLPVRHGAKTSEIMTAAVRSWGASGACSLIVYLDRNQNRRFRCFPVSTIGQRDVKMQHKEGYYWTRLRRRAERLHESG
ncbi:hypothetical protein HBH98_013710 [Parastagonospora nodorum]|nr:hypothetical protein HBH52_080380 [Parastagonospora nodorum]KAH4058634.1 hypothetical protein HBH49_035730 [Parastagonospora nodorum]KAH4133170.1 hypothetical protein HBH47_011500 [Parastagonospora nodorum]KAH4238124.1 hypothetical protein HBI06_043390 [Parastagonospora nodorum]KAH4271118.1 hypothetical protein HBI03_038650 [Parastagonospora nodorum]